MVTSLWRLGSLVVAQASETADRASASLHGPIAFALLAAVVLTAAVFDFRTRRIPNLLLGPAFLAGFMLAAVFGFIDGQFAGAMTGLKNAGLAMLAGFVPMYLLYLAGATHGGDVKMMATIGAIAANWEVVLGTAFYGFLAAAVVAMVIMFRRGIVKQTLSRIANAALLAAAKVKPDLDGPESPQIPLAVGFAIGAVLSGIEHLLHVRLPWS